MLKPTAYLTISLQPQDATTEIASALKRTYSYIAPVRIVADMTDDAADEHRGNTIAMEVRIPAHPYIVAGDEAEKTWEQTVLPWLLVKLDTLFGSVYEFNNEKRKSFVRKLGYDVFELTLESRPVVFALEDDCSLRSVEKPLRAVRAWLLGEGANKPVERILVPSDAQRGDADWFDAVLADGETVRVEIA